MFAAGPTPASAAPGGTRSRMGLLRSLRRILRRPNSLRLLSATALRLPRLLRALPRHAHAAEVQEQPLDYASLEGWSAHPRRPPGTRHVEDANHLEAPVGVGGYLQAPPPASERPCDCFFVHDTCFTQHELLPFLGEIAPRWNAPVRELHPELTAKVNEQVDLRVAAGAAPFGRLCRLYAPRYRQVNVVALATYMPPSPLQRWADLQEAIELAYQDLVAAFVHFIQDPATAGRPFFLASHSQGTMHLTRLVQEQVEPFPDRRARFVHGYLAGQTVPMTLFRSLRHVRPSASASDVCSVSSWRTGAPEHNVLVFCGMVFHAGRGWLPSSGKVLATNPVTWEEGAGARSSHPGEYLGATFPLPENLDPRENQGLLPCGVSLRYGELVEAGRHVLGARLQRLSPIASGEVTVTVDSSCVTRVPRVPADSLFALTEHDFLMYHDLDIAFFHGNIQANAKQRYQAWQLHSRM